MHVMQEYYIFGHLEDIMRTETEEIRDNLEVTEKGRIRQSIQNCKYVGT